MAGDSDGTPGRSDGVWTKLQQPVRWPTPISIEIQGIDDDSKAREAEQQLRARPGVLIFYTGSGPIRTPILVSATGDLRDGAASRLRGEGANIDLSGVVTRIEACECGSGFEADLAHASISSLLTPESFHKNIDARSPAYVHLDPMSRTPACRVICDHAKRIGLAPSSLIGPFARKSHAESFAAMLDERFSLCREPATLSLYPNAKACSYKEMGACPAPCDGSEPMTAYLARVGSALEFDGRAISAELEGFDRGITEAASALKFEAAASLKAEREAFKKSIGSSWRWITSLDRFGAIAVMSSGKRGWARVFLHCAGETRALADVSATGEESAVLVRQLMGLHPHPMDSDRRVLVPDRALSADLDDGAALLFAHMRSSRKIRGSFLPIEPMPSDETIAHAIRRAAGVETDVAIPSGRRNMSDRTVDGIADPDIGEPGR